MNSALLLGLFDPMLNWLRELGPSVRAVIILVALLFAFTCIARCISVGKDHADKPIRWVILGLGIICFGIALFVGFI